MEKKMRIFLLICSSMLIIGSVVFLISRYTIPGVLPILMAMIMFGLWLQSKSLYKREKVSKTYFIVVSIGILLGVILNIAAAVFQLINCKNDKMPSANIIGGADGSTAIFMASSFSYLILVLSAVTTIIIAVMIIFIARKLMKK